MDRTLWRASALRWFLNRVSGEYLHCVAPSLCVAFPLEFLCSVATKHRRPSGKGAGANGKEFGQDSS